ncbi:DUF4097 domain-containing protein [Alkalihalobacillus sp. MEB130]|uniref:DUF4097 family beta strand repeat-containing protein n=1 Tax=Alkalihalobacillus sp. MEB130 TaxID=2976704 RepID=UPI0028E050F2|nr:DUF4097 domain-containing protein [Alkalihalobacillus sp. MEB130]MDT8858745.1 DUF4097 domain-containing protein [Alkalihalobacillus sp. MEB130]
MEERKMVLKMIEDGKITAEEGVKLLEAMEKTDSGSQKTKEEQPSMEMSTKVNWDEGEQYRDRARHAAYSTANMFTSFIESTIQKIKDVDLDFNFGSSVEVDHIFQHRDISPASVDVSLENGSITFKPWDEADVRVECKAKVYRVKDSEEARRTFLQETSFRVDERKLLFHTKTKSMKVQTTIYIPRQTFDHIKLYTFNGQINGGTFEVDTLDVNAINGPLTFSSVKAKKVMGETVNGAIEFKQVEMDVIDAKTLHGGITLAGKVQDFDAETINGSITYEIDELEESGYADLKATTGSIHLFIPKSNRIEGKLKTNVGAFTIDLSEYETLEEKKEFAQKSLSFIGNQQSSPRIKVNATTNTGSVLVKDQK